MIRIRKYIPEFLKEAYRRIRARLFSIGLSKDGPFPQPDEEVLASDDFSVIVAIHDSPEVTARCLDSLQRYAGKAEVILVDDGSRLKETRNLIADFQQRNGWRVIRHDKPVRHSRACEHGSQYATRPYLCFLNSDTVVTPWSWGGAKDAFEADPKIAVVGPATSTYTHQLASRQALYCNLYWENNQIYNFAQKYISKQPQRSWVDVQIVAGFAFFIRRDVWNELGGFHPNLPDYGNETELCKRLIRQGFRIILTRNSYVHHFTGSSSMGRVMTRTEIVERQLSAKRFIDNLHGPS